MIAVLGTGVMGKGIAIEFARFGNKVLQVITEDSLVIDNVRDDISGVIDRSKLENKDQILGNIELTKDLSKIKDKLIVVEAIVENLEAKQKYMTEVNKYLRPEAIMASNTSSLSIKKIFESIPNKNRVLGIHFFNPAHVMKLVEISRTADTSDETVNKAKELVETLEKDPVFVKDSPGFIVNRLLIPMINEASKMLDEGVASAEDIDKAMKLGANHPIGPLKLSDLIGNDVVSLISDILKKNIDLNTSSKGLKELVKEKKLGRKTKAGFYDYQ